MHTTYIVMWLPLSLSYFIILCFLFFTNTIRALPYYLSKAVPVVSIFLKWVLRGAVTMIYSVTANIVLVALKDRITAGIVKSESHGLPAATAVTGLDRILCFENWHCAVVLDTSILTQKPIRIEHFCLFRVEVWKV